MKSSFTTRNPQQALPPPELRRIRIIASQLSAYRPGEFKSNIQRFKAGKKYEEKVNTFLQKHVDGAYILQQSFEYKSTRDGGWKIKIPDAYLVQPDRIICVEIKLSHCYEAWTSLRGVYQPLLHHYYERPVEVVEVCKNYASSINIPEEVVEITFDDLRNRRFPDGGGKYHIIMGDL